MAGLHAPMQPPSSPTGSIGPFLTHREDSEEEEECEEEDELKKSTAGRRGFKGRYDIRQTMQAMAGYCGLTRG